MPILALFLGLNQFDRIRISLRIYQFVIPAISNNPEGIAGLLK